MIEEDALFGEIGQPNSETALFEGEAGRQSAAWDLRQAPRNYVTLMGAQAIASLLSFTSVWLATRYLGPAGYGGVVAFIAAAQVVMLVAVNWTSISVARFGCEEFVGTGHIAVTFWTRLIVLIPNLLLVLAAAPLWLPRLSRLLVLPPGSTWLVLGLLVVNAWWIHIQQALQGAKLLRLQGWLLAVERTLIFLALGGLAVSGTISISKVGWLYVLGPAGASLIGLAKLGKLIWPVQVDFGLLKRLLRFSVPLIPTALVGYLQTNYLDALFITHFLSQAKLGIYSVAYQLAGLTQQLPLLAGTLLMPLFVTLKSGRQENSTERYMREVLPPVTLLWVITCALLAAAGAYLVPLIFGARFAETALLLWPLMAASAIAGPALMGYTPVTTSTAKTHLQMVAVTLASCANVILDLLLIPRYGLVGCAWATTAAYGTHLVVVFLLVHWRVMPKPTWVLEATFPIVLGALYASLFSRNAIALGITMTAAVVIGLAHRGSFVSAFTMLREYGHFVSYSTTRLKATPEANKA
jgi:O-antigen/teichoic acid export membrane protein